MTPLTGWFRDGCCNTDQNDLGLHTLCAEMTEDFLEFSRAVGNDLSTPRPEYGFAGLKAGRSMVPLRAAVGRSAAGRLRAQGRAGRHA
jgi:uncharacterized protein (DUF2237 family)